MGLKNNRRLAWLCLLVFVVATVAALISSAARQPAVALAVVAAILMVAFWPWDSPQDLVNPIKD